MTKEQAEEKIIALLSKRKNKIIGKNIVSASLSLFSNPVDAVDKLFFGVNDETSDEKLKLQQDLILELICQISESFEKMQSDYKSKYNEESSILIDGIIKVDSTNSKTVTGVHIKNSSKQVEFKSGTIISVNTNNTGETTGLKIGD
jgi:hypothetical protein